MAGPSRAYLWWKGLKLPWRRQRLVGSDLAGNTFWIFKDALNSNRFRRIVKYSKRTAYADIKISPQWHQWLRHTRLEAPTIEEQQADELRKANMKHLAARADERWNSVPSFLDAPAKSQTDPAVQRKVPGGYVPSTQSHGKQGVSTAVGSRHEPGHTGQEELSGGSRLDEDAKDRQSNPWTRSHHSESEPNSWQPGTTLRR